MVPTKVTKMTKLDFVSDPKKQQVSKSPPLNEITETNFDIEKQEALPVLFRMRVVGWLMLLAAMAILCMAYCDNKSDIYIALRSRVKLLENSPDDCEVILVESIPVGLNYSEGSPVHMNTTESWLSLINSARKSIEIASMYWTMKREDVNPPDDSAIEGEMVFNALVEAGSKRNVSLKIVQSKPGRLSPNKNTEELAKIANAEVRTVDFPQLIGQGILHTKLWIIDRERVYVGSANMDWRALTQVKELGLVTTTCPKIANDLGKIFDVYWYLGKEMKIPDKWPETFGTNINSKNPMDLTFGGNSYKAFFASSPPQVTTQGRENDVDAILRCIKNAKKFVYISVMDYFPLMIYGRYVKFWPIIDDALRTAAVDRKVEVRLLISWWKSSRKSESYFLNSLTDITDSFNGVKIEVRRFIVPHTEAQGKIPYARVNHNKYMVTDETAYIGTSNWSGDYFTYTAGIGMVFDSDHPQNANNLRQQLQDIFERDWGSPYAHPANATR